MLSNALLCDDLAALPRTFKGVAFYLDTPFLLILFGLKGDARRVAAEELLDLLTKLKGEVCVFHHTYLETYAVIAKALESIGLPVPRTLNVIEMEQYGVVRSDLQLLNADLAGGFERAGISRRRTPDYSRAVQVDEVALEKAIEEEIKYWSHRALETDVNSIRRRLRPAARY